MLDGASRRSSPLSLLLALLAGAVPAQAAAPGIHERLDTVDARWHGATVVADGVDGGAAHFDGDRARIDVGPCPVDAAHSFTLRCALRTRRGDFCTPLMARAGDAVGLSLVVGRRPARSRSRRGRGPPCA
ncbi:MAG: hypothetical protein U1E73_13985 [Planctomycetota bacterium]